MFVAAIIFVLVGSPDEPDATAIVVSAAERTYVEAVTKQRAEGFLDPFSVLAVYYIRVGGWFQETQRVQVLCGGHNSTNYDIGFRRRVGRDGQLQIEVKRRRTYDEIKSALIQELAARQFAQHLLHPDTPPQLLTTQAVQALEASARARALAKDSLILTVFTPPAVFPEAEAKLHRHSYDCRKD